MFLTLTLCQRNCKYQAQNGWKCGPDMVYLSSKPAPYVSIDAGLLEIHEESFGEHLLNGKPGDRQCASLAASSLPSVLLVICLLQLGVNSSIAIQGFNAQLPECFAADYALNRHLDQGTEKEQLSIYLRRETLGVDAF